VGASVAAAVAGEVDSVVEGVDMVATIKAHQTQSLRPAHSSTLAKARQC
jgi:hypothetical protein